MTGPKDPNRYSRYTGRGLDWAKKPITKRRAKRVGRYLAGAIIRWAIEDGWGPEDLKERFGEEGFKLIEEHVEFLSDWLMDTGEEP